MRHARSGPLNQAMRDARVGARLAVLVGCLVAGVAAAQTTSTEAMGAEVERLFRQGNYAEATRLGNQALALAESGLGPEHPEVGHALYRLGVLHRTQGQLDVAEEFATRSLAVFEKAHGPRHQSVAKALAGMASVRSARGDLEGSQALNRRAIEIYEEVLGPDHPDVAIGLNNLAGSYFSQGKYDLAEPLWRRALAIREKTHGASHAEVAQSLFNLGILRWYRGDRPDAESLLLRAMKIEEVTLGPNHPTHAKTMVILGGLYRDMGREAESEDLHLRGLAIQEKSLGPQHVAVAETVVNLGNLYYGRARYDLAEPAYRRAIAIYEAAKLAEHFYAASAMANLAAIYLEQGRLLECEPLLLRALAIMEKQRGAQHPDVADQRRNLALVRIGQGRKAEAEPLMRDALAIYEKLGAERVNNAMLAMNDLGQLLAELGRFAEAQPILERSYDLRVTALGPGHPDVASSLVSLGDLDVHRLGLEAARGRFARSLAIRENVWGFDHLRVAESLDRLAAVDAAQGRLADALGNARRASTILAARFSDSSGHGGAGLRAEQRRLSQRYATHVAILDRIRQGDAGGQLEEAFRIAQLARASDTAAQLAQMAVRHASGDDRLAGLVRSRQDEENRFARTESEMLALWSAPADASSIERAAALRARREQIRQRIVEIDATLQREFPRYRDLVDPRPVDVEEIRALLGAREALASFLVAEDAAYVWVVTRRGAVFRRLDTDRERLDRSVRALRRHLDPDGDAARVLRAPFPYDVARALYRQLLGPVEAQLRDVQHLIVVPDGPLQSLPFGVLVTDSATASTATDPAQAAWLIKRHAISVLPAESSLRALRATVEHQPRREPFGGFGDPLLDGSPGPRGAFPVALRSRGGVADVREVRKLPRLPDTADELRSIASSLRAGPAALFLRESASERQVKSADLQKYRTLAFATHGLVAGELEGLAEPALVLTPPAQGSEADDGLLTASEIAQLRLNADWVILSACNTAADDGGPGAEGLSGLAKAFFYSGARSLLVSHWAVSSEATVALTTGMFRHFSAGSSKAEALRRSMLQLMRRKGELPYAHPMLWAPFVVVGEGNR